MSSKTREFDAYIANAQPFARPILTKVRSLFHKAYPKIGEELKWGHPSFVHKGIVGGMAAFKKHCVWGLWKSSLIKRPKGALGDGGPAFGRDKLTDVSQLPPDAVMIDMIRQAVELNEKGVKSPQQKKTRRPPPKTPPDLAAALKKNAKATAVFQAFSPTNKRDYIDWITEAKQDATRERRLKQAMEWIAQGKPRNWKYMSC